MDTFPWCGVQDIQLHVQHRRVHDPAHVHLPSHALCHSSPCYLHFDLSRHRVFTFIVGIQFWHIRFSGTFLFLPYSHTLLVFLSLSHSPPSLSLFNSLPLSLTHSLPHLSLSLSYSPHLSLSHSPFSISFYFSLHLSPLFFLSI